MSTRGSYTAYDFHDWPAETNAARLRAQVAAAECARRLSEALHDPDRTTRCNDPELEASIVAYVRALKAQRLSPEQTLIIVKRLLTDAIPESEEFVRLKQSAVAWMIQAYYHGA